MSYQVKEIFYSLQGEGAHSGRAAVFCRFAGCNLWSGRESDRAAAKCYFCDTDFVGTDGAGGGRFQTAAELAGAIAQCWESGAGSESNRLVIFTGGEPTLQLDEPLLAAVKPLGFSTAIETNGTGQVPDGIDWITVSPKPNAPIVQQRGNELKLVYPHDVQPEAVAHLEFDLFFLSPLTSPDEILSRSNVERAVAYCKANPQWRLTGQYHKLWGIP